MNCLSIDFDIIMKPAIELYNDLTSATWRVRDLEKEYPILSVVLPPDYSIYQYVTRFVLTMFKKLPQEKVFFIEHHRTAAKLLEGYKDISLCNIDHHHDVGYDIKPQRWLAQANDGDWVKYLMDRKSVIYYTWVCNDNSYLPSDDLRPIYVNKFFQLKQVDLDQFTNNIDMLILCHSPEWIPIQYDKLWQIWIDLAETWYGTEFVVT